MGRGRKAGSVARDRMQQVVDALGVSYGYEIFKAYEAAFSPIELRSVYYHLNKGIGLEEFELVGVKAEKGPFTWGDISIRRYYILGPEAKEHASEELRTVVNEAGLKRRDPKEYVDWEKVFVERFEILNKEFSILIKARPVDPEKLSAFNNKLSLFYDWFKGNKVKINDLEVLIREVSKVLLQKQ